MAIYSRWIIMMDHSGLTVQHYGNAAAMVEDRRMIEERGYTRVQVLRDLAPFTYYSRKKVATNAPVHLSTDVLLTITRRK
jgi:hypothetical protein